MANWTQQIINNVKGLKEKSSLLSGGNWTDEILARYSPKYITDPYKKVSGGIDFKKFEGLNKKKAQATQAVATMPDEFERPDTLQTTFISQSKKSTSIIANNKIKEAWVKNELFKQLPFYKRNINNRNALYVMPYYELRREFPEVEQLEQRYKDERLSPTDKAEDVALDRIRLSQKKFTTTDIYDSKTDSWRAKNIKREYVDPNRQLYDEFETTTELFFQSIPAGLVGYETEVYKKALESGDFMTQFAASSGNLLGFVGGLKGVGLVTKGLGLTGKVTTGLTKIGIGERKARIAAELIKSGVDFTLLGQVHSTVRGDSWKEHFKSAGVDFASGVGLTIGGLAVSKLPKLIQPLVEGSVWAGIAKAQGADNQTALIQGILFGGMRGFGLMKPSLEGVNEVTADKFLIEAEKFLKVKRTDTKGIVEAFEKKTKNLKQGTLEYQKAEASAVALLYPRQVFGMIKNVSSFQESRPVGLFGKGKFKKGERPGIEKAAPLPEDFAQTLRGTKGLTADDIMKTYPNIQLKKDIPAKDIYGNRVEIPEGEKLTPYELKGNKILLQDGETYIVSKNQFENIKGQSVSAEGKPFAPELEGVEETRKGAGVNEEGFAYLADTSRSTKYSQYQLPGGENYKEVLIKAPSKQYGLSDEGIKARESGTFRSPHWDEPNVISHLRMNERTYNGKKVAFMEELQSDWAREGRSKGFATDITKDFAKQQGFTVSKLKSTTGDEAYFIDNPTDEFFYRKGFTNTGFDTEARAWESITKKLKETSGAVPPHPLLKNWQELSVKRALKEAVDNNSQYFAWISGEQTSARYNLATQVDNVDWSKGANAGEKWIKVYTKDARAVDGGKLNFVIDKDGVITQGKSGTTGKKLDEVLGKGLADKIMEKESGTLSGEGLKFGGEWATNLYDKQVKNIVEDLTGGKVEVIDMGLPVETKTTTWFDSSKKVDGRYVGLDASKLKVGMETHSTKGEYIITDILGEGKFKAVPKSFLEKYDLEVKDVITNKTKTSGRYDFSNAEETFDISQKTTQQQAIKLTPEIKAKIRGEAPEIETSERKFEQLPSTTLKTDRSIGIGGEKKLTPEDLYRRGKIGEYEYNQKIKKSIDPIVKAKGFFNTIGEIADKYVGTISTRLANINPEIKTSMRRFEFDTRMATKSDIEKSMPMLKKIKSMDKADRADFDLARKNGDKEVVDKIAKKYGMEKELMETRAMLDNVYKRLQEVGYDKIQYLTDYFPRVIKDSKGFLEYLTGTKDWPLIQKAIQAHEKKIGRNLEVEEKATLINTLLRGFRSSTISLSEIGAAKTRTIEKISPELNQFYMDTDSALLHYINSANESIAARKFFGKGKETSIDDSIGMYVLDLIQKGEIAPTQEIELTNILKARFNARGPGAAMNVFKNLSYIGAMGSPSSAITQIGDVAFTLYKGGVVHTAKGVYKSLFGGKSKITKQDIGIEKIAQEFEDATLTGKAVSSTFKVIGLNAMDTFGKNSLINAMFSRYKSELNNPKRSKATENKLRKIFGEETSEVIDDIKTGKTSENVKFLLFNELSEVQPISLLEVPEGYLKGGNGRVFYMLKTYTVKLFDVYRNEVFKQIANKGTRIEGTKNLIKLTAALMTMNASADFIKDFLFGRNIDLEDIVVDNIFKLFGVSRYITWQARTEGIYTAITKQILPPFSFIDNAGKDVAKFFTDQDKLLEEGFESAQSVPLVGKLYYWWLGKGKAKSEKERIGGEYRPFKLIRDSKDRILTPEEKQEILKALDKAEESGEITLEQYNNKVKDIKKNQFNIKTIQNFKEAGYSKEVIRAKLQAAYELGEKEKGHITKAQAKDIYAAF